MCFPVRSSEGKASGSWLMISKLWMNRDQVGSAAAQIRAQVRLETDRLMRERDALQTENERLRGRHELDRTMIV